MKLFFRRIVRYNPCDIIGDAIAGFTVGVVAVPQSLMLSAIAGIPFEYSIYAALLGCILYPFFGHSKHVIMSSSSLTLGLISMYVRSSEEWIPQKATTLTFVSGTAIIIAAVLSAGRLVNRLSSFVLAGFVWANVMTIATTEVYYMLGIRHGAYSMKNFQSIFLLLHLHEAAVWDTVMSACCVVLLLALAVLRNIQISPDDRKPRTIHKIVDRTFQFLSNISGALVLMLATLIAYHFSEESKTSPFALTGSLNFMPGFPVPTLPPFNTIASTDPDWRVMVIPPLLTPVLTIIGHTAILRALSGGEETLTGWELSSVGIINLVGSFFSCAPLVANFSSSSINAYYGARSRLSSLFAGLVLVLCISGLTAPFHEFIPRAAASSVILFALFHLLNGITRAAMREEHNRIRIVGGLATFFIGTFFSLEYGLVIGIMVDITICAFMSQKVPVIAEKLQSPDGTPYILVSSNADTKLPTVAMYQEAVSKNRVLDDESAKYMTVVIDCKHITLANLNTAHEVYLLMEYFRNVKTTIIFHNLDIDVAKAFSAIFPPDFLHSPSETHLRRLFRAIRIETEKKAAGSDPERGTEATEDTNC